MHRVPNLLLRAEEASDAPRPSARGWRSFARVSAAQVSSVRHEIGHGCATAANWKANETAHGANWLEQSNAQFERALLPVVLVRHVICRSHAPPKLEPRPRLARAQKQMAWRCCWAPQCARRLPPSSWTPLALKHRPQGSSPKNVCVSLSNEPRGLPRK